VVPRHPQAEGTFSQAPRDTELFLTRLLAECSLVLVFLLAGQVTSHSIAHHFLEEPDLFFDIFTAGVRASFTGQF